MKRSLVFACGLAISGLAVAGILSQFRGVGPSQDLSRVRVVTYNLEWWNSKVLKERLTNVRSVLHNINGDIIGVQEVEDRISLAKVFDKNYTIGLIDDKAERQNTGIVVRKPYVLKSYAMLFPSASDDFAFPGKRDAFHAVIETPGKDRLDVIVLHLKSRRGGRLTTDPQRHQAAFKLTQKIKQEGWKNVIILGDLNDGSDDMTCEILETGSADGKSTGSPLMVNLMEPLYRKDYVSIDLARKFTGKAIEPRVEGAFADNERLKGQDYKFPDDVKVTQTLFDHILFSPTLASQVKAGPTIYSGVDALRGSDDSKAQTLSSDHLPVYVDLKLPLKK